AEHVRQGGPRRGVAPVPRDRLRRLAGQAGRREVYRVGEAGRRRAERRAERPGAEPPGRRGRREEVNEITPRGASASAAAGASSPVRRTGTPRPPRWTATRRRRRRASRR